MIGHCLLELFVVFDCFVLLDHDEVVVGFEEGEVGVDQ